MKPHDLKTEIELFCQKQYGWGPYDERTLQLIDFIMDMRGFYRP